MVCLSLILQWQNEAQKTLYNVLYDICFTLQTQEHYVSLFYYVFLPCISWKKELEWLLRI